MKVSTKYIPSENATFGKVKAQVYGKHLNELSKKVKVLTPQLVVKDAKKKKIHEQCYNVSAVTGAGINELLGGVAHCLSKTPVETEKPVKEKIKRYTLDDEFTIEVINNQFMVKGRKVEKLAAMTPANLEESVHRLQHIFKKMGLNSALKKKGISQGDTVCICKMTFLWEEA